MATEGRIDAGLLRQLMSGRLSWDVIEKILRAPKTLDRFAQYMAAVAPDIRVTGKPLLRLNEYLYIVGHDTGIPTVQCGRCGYDFGDYRVNWKLNSDVYVRRSKEEFLEIYRYEEVIPEENYAEIREYYCPGCYTLLCVECVPPGYPPIFEFLPDVEGFYRDVLGQAIPGGAGGSPPADLTYEAVKEHFPRE